MRTAPDEDEEDGDDDVFIVDVSSWVPVRRSRDDGRDANRTASCPHLNEPTTTTEATTTSRTDRRARAIGEHESNAFSHPLGGYFTARRDSWARTEEEASKPRVRRRGKRFARAPPSELESSCSSASASGNALFNWTTTTNTTTTRDAGEISDSFSFGDENDDPSSGASFRAQSRAFAARMFIHAARRRVDALRAARGAVASPALDVPRVGGPGCTKHDAFR